MAALPCLAHTERCGTLAEEDEAETETSSRVQCSRRPCFLKKSYSHCPSRPKKSLTTNESWCELLVFIEVES